MDGGLVADGELVIPGGDRPVALEPVNPAFDSVALLVQFGVEGWRAAAGAALVLAVADLVGLVWDGAPDPPSPQVGAVSPGTVGLISQHPPRPGAGTAPPRPGHPDAFQHGLELRTVTTLPRGDEPPAASGAAHTPDGSWWTGPRASGPAHDQQARRRRSRPAAHAAGAPAAGHQPHADAPGTPWNRR